MNAPDFIRAEELLQVLFQSPNATAVYSGESITILSVNAAMLSLWGKDKTVVGKSFREAIPELADQPFFGILQRVWRSGETYVDRDQPASLNIDGNIQLLYFDFEYKAILDENGKTKYILHTAFEVSQRRKAWKLAEEKSIAEQKLSEELTAINEEFQTANEDLSALNEEYHAANENLAALNEEYQVSNEELQRTQEQLQKLNHHLTESEEKFRSLVELAPVAIAIYTGPDMIIEQANEQMLKIWGQDKGAIGQPLLVARPELIGHEYIAIIRNVITSGNSHIAYGVKGPVTINREVVDGYFDVIYKPFLVKAGNIPGIIVVASDVTEQTLARMREEEINEEITAINEELTASNEELIESQQRLMELNDSLNLSEQRFRKMVEHSPVAMASLKGSDFEVDVVNEMVLEIWGKDHSVLGKPLEQALPELDGQQFIGLLREVFDTGIPFYGKELKAIINTQGTLKDRYLNFVYQPVAGSDGMTDSILIVANDVTDQFLARKSVDDLNTRLEIALDASKLGSTEVVVSTGKMESTAQFKRNYGYEPEEDFSYADLFASMFPEHHERVRGLVREAMATNGVYKTEYPIRWRDGSVHWIQAHGRPRYDENGKADRMVGMTLDITEAKLFEQRKDDFLSIASHELKTPITSLKASIQLLDRIKDKPFSDMHIRLIEQANKSVHKMSFLVGELLNLSRLSGDQLNLERTSFNLHDMMTMCCSHVRLEGKYKLILKGENELCVYADEHRIDQVIVNFVNNAVKYAPESLEIHMQISSLGNAAKVSVTDFGQGIDEKILPNLFDRYYRVDRSEKSYNGLGLGLYICKEIIEKHGGEIGVESTIGQGSTFWFTLPL
ncbi:ATP-binding protein [Pedobacter sp. AW31-3R]|uniref:ATP-binding protein n=1 Tax=Pedobacter sp. AW31-3R TaxID=3445781 RepID=UPI003F9EC05E